MTSSRRIKRHFIACSAVLFALTFAHAQAQQQGGTPQNINLPPVNSGANPYKVIRDWAKLDKEGRPQPNARSSEGFARD